MGSKGLVSLEEVVDSIGGEGGASSSAGVGKSEDEVRVRQG